MKFIIKPKSYISQAYCYGESCDVVERHSLLRSNSSQLSAQRGVITA